MVENWYYAKDGRRCGPFTFEQLRQMAASGMLHPTDMVLNEADRKWVSANAVPGLTFAPTEMARATAAVPPPVAVLVSDPAPTPGALPVASWFGFPLAPEGVAPVNAGGPRHRLFRLRTILPYSLFPLVSCLAMAFNYLQLGCRDAARRLAVAGVVWYVVLLILYLFAPTSVSTIFFLISAGTMLLVSLKLMGGWWKQHQQAGGQAASEVLPTIVFLAALLPFCLLEITGLLGPGKPVSSSSPANSQRAPASEIVPSNGKVLTSITAAQLADIGTAQGFQVVETKPDMVKLESGVVTVYFFVADEGKRVLSILPLKNTNATLTRVNDFNNKADNPFTAVFGENGDAYCKGKLDVEGGVAAQAVARYITAFMNAASHFRREVCE